MPYNLSTKIKAGLLVGTLDILGAFAHYYLKTNKNPLNVLNFVASGILGNKAFPGNSGTMLLGLLFHFIIAFSFTFFFFAVFSKLKSFIKFNVLIAILYSVFMWCITQFIVVPLSSVPKGPFVLVNQLMAIGVLVICIGIPLTLIADKHSRIG